MACATVNAVVESVNLETREVVLKRADGEIISFIASDEVRNLAQVDHFQRGVRDGFKKHHLRLRAHRGGNIASGVWLIGGAVRLLERAKPGIIASELKSCAAYTGAVDAASKVSVPVMIISGRHDKMTPVKSSLPLVDVLANARKHVIEGAGHMMMLEAQQETRRVIYQFCRGVAETD